MKLIANNYAFIDSQNVYLSIKGQNWDLDWGKFRIYLHEHYGVEKAFLFIGYIKGNEDLYSRLQQAGFICIFKIILKYKNGNIKGNVDAEMVLHTVHEINNYDKAVIVTGDGDFYCLVKYLKERNKLKVVLVPNRKSYSALLKRYAGKDITFMNEIKHHLKNSRLK
jgi:uncharacterized LabA/DUF88 family protein